MDFNAKHAFKNDGTGFLIIRCRYVPLFGTVNTEFADKKSKCLTRSKMCHSIISVNHLYEKK